MRAMLALGSMALSIGLGGCQVTEDKGNGSTTVEYNADVASNAVTDVANTAQDIGGAIAADAKREAGKVENKVGDVNLTVDTDKDNTNGNAADADHNAR